MNRPNIHFPSRLTSRLLATAVVIGASCAPGVASTSEAAVHGDERQDWRSSQSIELGQPLLANGIEVRTLSLWATGSETGQSGFLSLELRSQNLSAVSAKNPEVAIVCRRGRARHGSVNAGSTWTPGSVLAPGSAIEGVVELSLPTDARGRTVPRSRCVEAAVTFSNVSANLVEDSWKLPLASEVLESLYKVEANIDKSKYDIAILVDDPPPSVASDLAIELTRRGWNVVVAIGEADGFGFVKCRNAVPRDVSRQLSVDLANQDLALMRNSRFAFGTGTADCVIVLADRVEDTLG